MPRLRQSQCDQAVTALFHSCNATNSFFNRTMLSVMLPESVESFLKPTTSTYSHGPQIFPLYNIYGMNSTEGSEYAISVAITIQQFCQALREEWKTFRW